MNQNSRAIAVLDRLRSKVGLTEDGRDALIQLANPFTDFESRRVGYFDANQAASVIQCVKKSTVVTAPGPASGNWDAHIFTMPIMGSVNVGNYGSSTGTFAGSGLLGATWGIPSESFLGCVNVITGLAGTDMSCTATPNVIQGQALSLGPTNNAYKAPFLDGNSRLIGMAFEVHNTTAPLHKQGAVAVYHQPQNSLLDRSVRTELSNTGPVLAPTTVRISSPQTNHTLADVPRSLQDVMLLSGSRQWEAADGCMCIPTLVSNDIPTVRRESVVPVVINAGETYDLHFNAVDAKVHPACAPRPSIPAGLPVVPGIYCTVNNTANKFTNFNTVGAYFSGLSQETTLVVNTIYYIERFPTPAETDLVVLAQPGPPSDPIAKELYSILMREMPPGVKVGDNADGDWFYSLVSGAAKFLGPSLAAAGPLGMAGSVLANGAGAWADERLRQNKKTQKTIQAKPKKAPVKQGSTWAEEPKRPKNQTKAQKRQVHKNWTSKSGM
jgi:hypothetical protein